MHIIYFDRPTDNQAIEHHLESVLKCVDEEPVSLNSWNWVGHNNKLSHWILMIVVFTLKFNLITIYIIINFIMKIRNESA